MTSSPGLSIKGDKYKDAIAALCEHAEPDAQRLLREAGIPPPSGQDEESPAKQLSKAFIQEYKRVTGAHRALISKKIRLQAKTEALKKQFEEAVDQLTAVSGKIEAVEQEIEKAHAQVKEKINAPRQPRITGVTSLLKEAGVTLSPDQTGALTKFLATVGDQALDAPSLWKAEAGVPRKLLESDWFSQDADGRNEEYGPTRIDHRTRSNPLSRRSRSPTREGTTAETYKFGVFGVEAGFPWRPGLCTRQSPAEANKRYGCESVGESQSLSEVASGKEQAGAWHRVASKRCVCRVFRPEILSSSNHSTHGRHENAQLACHSVVGTGFPVQSRCLAAHGVDRQPTQVLGGEFLALAWVSPDPNFFPPVSSQALQEGSE